MLGLILPSEGEIRLNGVNILELSDRQLTLTRQHIGTVFQQSNLIEHRTVRENVAVPLWIRGMPKRDIRSTVDAMLETVGLETEAHLQPHHLSSGDQQRVAIARALITQPKVLFADEPTGNLDSELSRQIVSLFRQEVARGTTVVIVTHDEYLMDHELDEVDRFRPHNDVAGASTFPQIEESKTLFDAEEATRQEDEPESE